MTRYVVSLETIDRTQVTVAGGKGAHLGELLRIDGVRVPPGFCVTTDAFRRVMALAPSIDDALRHLARVGPDDRDAIRAISRDVRHSIEATSIPHDVAAAISQGLSQIGERSAYAVRSSATAEDLPTASFAGQHDSYLDVVGEAAILEHVRRCWASLFTERAVTYRIRNGIDHRKVQMAVVVQQMVQAHAAGVLFTADPVTGNRKVSSVEATVGLGEALVSGLVNADVYKVRDGEIVTREERHARRALSDAQVLKLAQLGRRIEAHFGQPQDVEWCRVDDDVQIVQSRPITTLFPIPHARDNENHVYLSVSHQQMMTDATRPLGISIRQLTAGTTFHEAGARLWVDVSRALASPAGRAGLLGMAGKSDPLTGDALQTIIDRDFIPLLPNQPPAGAAPPGGVPAPAPIATDPAIVAELIARSEASVAALRRDIRTRSGPELLDFILADFQELKRVLFDPLSHQVIMAGTEATWWLNDKLQEWLGEKNAADALTQSVPDNVTSEMGLALLDVADVIRAHPDVVEFLERWSGRAVERSSGGAVERSSGGAVERSQRPDDELLAELGRVNGGAETRDAIVAWLEKYGMRGVAEIDITRPRWSERPGMLVPLILGNVRNFEPGESRRRFERGLEVARRTETDGLARLRAVPNGEQKAEETKRMIDRVRTFAGYREYPKYGMMSRYFEYRQALMGEARRLVQAGVLHDEQDIFYLTFPELQDVVRTHRVDERLIEERRRTFAHHETLTPPRVLTSEGEAVQGRYRSGDVPAGALAGLAVSAGTVEGRARVVLDFAKADLEPGDILVTVYTDPSWTPLFVAIKGLVTEIGGLMTHGAVIAREYGLPAVVALENATRLIRDGQRVRLNGTDGYVEILS